MITRLAHSTDMESIYMMGFDVWGSDSPVQQYLGECRTSPKYKQGLWYCLERNTSVVSSLLIYKNCLGLKAPYTGFGSIATKPHERKNGYASVLIKECVEMLTIEGCSGVYLFNETDSKIYENCGFESIFSREGVVLMFLSINGGKHQSNPDYF